MSNTWIQGAASAPISSLQKSSTADLTTGTDDLKFISPYGLSEYLKDRIVTVQARDWQDVVDVAAAYNVARPSKERVIVDLNPNKTYTALNPIAINTGLMGIRGNGSDIDHSAVGGQVFMSLDFKVSTPASNGRMHRSKVLGLSDFNLLGPGKLISGSVGILTNGTVVGLGVRPNIRKVSFQTVETGFKQQDRSYLAVLDDCSFYQNRIGIWQAVGQDAGENSTMSHGCFDGVDLQVYLQGVCEWTFRSVSFDYSNQLFVITGNRSRIFCYSPHQESRGSVANGDASNHSIILGYGGDARAVFPTRDSFIDIDNSGSLHWFGGSLDSNQGGATPPPFLFDHLINVRHKNSKAIFHDVGLTGMLNVSNKLWTGPGYVKFYNTITPSGGAGVPTRMTDMPQGNKLQDGIAADGGIEDLFFIYRDSATTPAPFLLTDIAGTADAITASFPPGITALVPGQAFIFTPLFDNATTTPQLNVGGSGNRAIGSYTGATASVAMLKVGVRTQVVWDGTIFRQMDNQRTIGVNGLIDRNTTPGMRIDYVRVDTQGAGYSSPPTITPSIGTATFTPVMSGGKLIGIIVTDPGYALASAPTLTITGGSPTTVATATAVMTNTGSWRIKKFGAAASTFRPAVAVAVVPGEQVMTSGFICRHTSGASTGQLYAEVRYARLKGYDKRGMPEFVNPAPYSSTAELPSSGSTPALGTGAWKAFGFGPYSDGVSGDAVAPEWATHAILIFQCDSLSAGETFIDQLTLSSL